MKKKLDIKRRIKARYGIKMNQEYRETVIKKSSKQDSAFVANIENYKPTYGEYVRNKDVDYEAIVCIASNNRFEYLTLMLDKLYNTETKNKFLIIVINDGSTDVRYDSLKEKYSELVFLENEDPNGKFMYWKTITSLFKEASKYKTNMLIQLDDDFLPCNNFIDISIDLFYKKKHESLKNDNIGAIAIHTCGHDQWNSIRWGLKYWIDGGGIYDIKFIKSINYQINEIPLSRWKNKPELSAGVWQQISKRLNDFNYIIFRYEKSLVYHLGYNFSKLNNVERNNNEQLITLNYIDDMKKILLAGPWVGEFGWELFCWIGYVRRKSKEFDETIVLCRPDKIYLYEDFATKIINFDSPFSKSNMWMGEIDENKLNNIIKNINYSYHLKPFNIGFGIDGNNDFYLSEEFKKQDHIKYDSDVITKKYDILVHPRNKIIGNKRNWNVDNWKLLIDKLKEKYSVALIGGDESFFIDGVDDYRNVDIKSLVSLMKNSKLVVGQSSGPLHLASLVGTPHFVWSDSSNKLRYEKYWNPHETKVYFFDKEGWNPNTETIKNEIYQILK